MKLIKLLVGSSVACIFAFGLATQQLNADTNLEPALDDSHQKSDTQKEEELSEAEDELVQAMSELAVIFAEAFLEMSDPLLDSAILDLGAEFSSKIEEFDTDNNGALSRTEMESIPEEEWDEEFKALTDEEREAELDEQFKALDLNQDGEISSEEVVNFVKNAKQQLKEELKNVEFQPSESDPSTTEPNSDN
ncbi:MAG: EF-hand domain-containing protein [Gammaproteobacteria bacterium]|nr:EF-hand domain-containing protein [Gammaproteobacteria bacterium]MDE0251530.1 EF-hand domain-containing protein [Gammaproteobacteria bacterium]MDE0403460.1 EF-hand domain-containing protein [Gammaproteobacteria bacterium]